MDITLTVGGVDAEISPTDISWQSKLGAGTTFSFPYPNQNGLARAVFREQGEIVQLRIPGMTHPLLEGYVITIGNDKVATIECADIIYFLSNKKIHPDELEVYVGWDIARVVAELLEDLDLSAGKVAERIVGTNPIIPLPLDFIEEEKGMDELVKDLLAYVKEQTKIKEPDSTVEYYFGFDSGFFRFERLPPIDTEVTHFEFRRDVDLMEEVPDFHFDRMVNRAVAFGKDSEGKSVRGVPFEDVTSIANFGVKEPESRLELETDNRYDLFIRARQEVLEKRDLLVTRNIDMPFTPWVTPGFYNVDIVTSVYGAEGKSRIIQVQGGIGPNGRIRVQLATVPLDEAEVLRKVVLGN